MEEDIVSISTTIGLARSRASSGINRVINQSAVASIKRLIQSQKRYKKGTVYAVWSLDTYNELNRHLKEIL